MAPSMTYELPGARSESCQRIGAFSISASLLDFHLGAVRAMLDGCIIVRAEMSRDASTIDYTAIHDDFEPIDPGRSPTPYTCVLTKHENGSVTRDWFKS